MVPIEKWMKKSEGDAVAHEGFKYVVLPEFLEAYAAELPNRLATNLYAEYKATQMNESLKRELAHRRGKAEEWREKGHLITSDSFVHWSWLCLWMLVFPTEAPEERPFRFAQMTSILEKFVLRCSSVVKRVRFEA